MSVARSQEMLNFALFAPPIAAPDAPRPGVDVGVPGRKLDLSGPVMGARYRLLHRLGKAGARVLPPVLTNAGVTRSSPEPVDPDAASAPLWAPVQAWPKWVVQATLG